MSIISMLASSKEKVVFFFFFDILVLFPKYNTYFLLILQKRPKGDKNYVQTCHKNPKKTRWLYDDDRA